MNDDENDLRSEAAAEVAAERCSFQLTYTRSPVQRMFSPGRLIGPPIDNAFGGEELASGEWDHGDDYLINRFTPEEWVDRYAVYAINEAVHEALEWFRVDDKPWLNPHGESEDLIYDAVAELCGRLAELRDTEHADA